MRALLDVNVLIAILDADHTSHARAVQWFASNAAGWASCPITQNGCVRIMSHANYPNPIPVAAIVARLADAASDPSHAFWPDDISLLDSAVADASRIHGPRQLTDVYLLALAVAHGGRFVTFDTGIAIEAVRRASRKHVMVL